MKLESLLQYLEEYLDVEGFPDYALAHAPPYQHPRHVEFMSELPLAGTNKVDRHLLGRRAREIAG